MELKEFKEKMTKLGAWEKFKEELEKQNGDVPISRFIEDDFFFDNELISFAFTWDITSDGYAYWSEIETKFNNLLDN